jgi:hypothetical protein
MSKNKLKKISKILKTTGLVAVALSLGLQFADLNGYLKSENRIEVLNWILKSKTGLSLATPAGKAFVRQFPPPPGEHLDNLTYLTKSVLLQEHGSIYNASVNYMRRDLSRTNFIATLDDVRQWASESPYPWYAWWLASSN